MSRFRWLAALALVLAIAPAAFAQTTPVATPSDPEGVTVTPFLGLGFAGNYENTPTTFGAALGYGLTERLSVEADVSFAPGGEQGAVVEFESRTWSLSGNVIYHFIGEDNFTPYVVGGIGVMGTDTDLDDLGFEDDGDTELAWNWGVGMKSVGSNRFGLRADLRYFNASGLVPDHWRLYGGVIIRQIGR